MAALCPGVQYGLSSQQNFGENKDLIFVRLTDSALRAIEEFLKNQNKFSQTPTIKFLGNENGELQFPSIHHQSGATSFSFSMSSTADMEGPGGSFECVQQIGTPRGSLECLGPISHKIRVQANEDVYEATRTRMTEAEDKYKNKCTREIKPNQTDIGRKVKVKQAPGMGMRMQQPAPPAARREVPLMRDTLLKGSTVTPYTMPPAQQQQQQQQREREQPSSYNSSGSPVNKMTNGGGALSNGLGSNHVSSSRPQLNKPSVPDIARRPLKERLIHLLALRPFKKVELYERLMKEGLREKNGMTSVLKQISFMKDNCFHLNRAMWNEVQDDWQFYTESEKQVLKRRKPQNLTPPGSSDGGSSGSGQSPTSTHPGSPPLSISSSSSSKRPPPGYGHHDGIDPLVPPNKRPRISHYRKPGPPEAPAPYARPPPPEQNGHRRPATDSRDSSNMNPRSRESPPTTTNNGHFGYANGTNAGDKRQQFSDDEDVIGSKKRSCDSHSLSFGVGRDKPPAFNNSSKSIAAAAEEFAATTTSTTTARKDPKIGGGNGLSNNGFTTSNNRLNKLDNERNKYSNKVSSSTQQNNRIARVSPDSQTEILPADLDQPRNNKTQRKIEEEEFPDYETDFTPIQSIEQRRRYKAEFNADYAEYRNLHEVVEEVSQKFKQLQERLKQVRETSPEYKQLKNQITKEYQKNKSDAAHQRASKRFYYLYGKLSHIKRLVYEYDQNVRQDGQY
ncbi:unnamed protein product [Brassicogethes aeneus]|uniref:OCEL domain-containing protein n=1 Tax=Brassicogethes aeneus TaxID=1431903 RepID=A0A9P0B2B7_BRAAE|nr:unnamed protein product [Brassicogethes aeneus]